MIQALKQKRNEQRAGKTGGNEALLNLHDKRKSAIKKYDMI